MDDERDGAADGTADGSGLFWHANNDSTDTDNLPPMERAGNIPRAGRYMDDGPQTAGAPTVGIDETLLAKKRVAYQLLHSETDIDRVTRIVSILTEDQGEEDEESIVGHQP